MNRDGDGGLCSNFKATLAFQQIKVRWLVELLDACHAQPIEAALPGHAALVLTRAGRGFVCGAWAEPR